MAEIFHVVRDGQVVELPDLSSIKAGEKYRVSTSSLSGKWRIAASDAVEGPKRGQWRVCPTTARRDALRINYGRRDTKR